MRLILTRDLRQTWPYGAAALAVLVINTASFARVLATRGAEQAAALTVQLPLDWLLAITWALYYGVILLNHPIPGTRQHWLSRPLRWQSLLAAKLLLLPLFALPVAAAHLVQLSLRGFPLADHAGPVIANAFWLVFAGLLPVAALASLCRNLQQLVLWLLALAAGILAIQQWDTALPAALQGVVNDVTVAASILACTAILIWQYATRRTAPARIATVVLAAIIATLPHWPAALWRPLVHSNNSPASLALLPSLEWNGEDLRVRFQVNNLGPQSLVRPTSWRIRAAANSADTTDIRIGGDSEFTRVGELSLATPTGFLDGHAAEPINVEITGDFTVFSTPRLHPLPSQGDLFLPGIGRCHTWIDRLQIIECQSVLGAARRLDITPLRHPATHPDSRTRALAGSREQSPFGLIPELHPIALLSGDLAASESSANPAFHLRTRVPLVHIQRTLELRGLKLVDLFPKPRQPQQTESSPLTDILHPPAPKPNSPLADGFFPHHPTAKAPQ